MSLGLSPARVNRALAFSNAEGTTATILLSMLSGTLLTAFALSLGASPLQVGLMASLGPAMQIGQVFTAYVVERVESRRRLTTWTLSLYRVIWAVAGLLALVLPSGWNLSVFMGLYAAAWLIGAPGFTGWQSLMTDLVPLEIRGRYFGRRWMVNTAIGIGALMLAGWAVDHYPGTRGFAVLYGLALVVTAMNWYCLTELPEIPQEVAPVPYWEHLRQPFRNPQFLVVVAWLAGWTLVQVAVLPFYTVLMATRLGHSYSLIAVLGSVLSLASALSFTLWGRLIDRRGPFWLAGPAAVQAAVVPLLWLLAGRFGVWYLVVLHVLLGIAAAGLQMLTLQMSMQLAPRDQRAVHLAVINGANGLAGFIGPLLAGVLAEAGWFSALFAGVGVVGLLLGLGWHFRLRGLVAVGREFGLRRL
jgi:MFS family permease